MVTINSTGFPTLSGRFDTVLPEIEIDSIIYYQDNTPAYVSATETAATFTSTASSPHDLYVDIDTRPKSDYDYAGGSTGTLDVARQFDPAANGVSATQTSSWMKYILKCNTPEGLKAITIPSLGDYEYDITINDDAANIIFFQNVRPNESFDFDLTIFELWQYTFVEFEIRFRNANNAIAIVGSVNPGAAGEIRLTVPEHIPVRLNFFNIFDKTPSQVITTINAFTTTYRDIIEALSEVLYDYPFIESHAQSIKFTKSMYAEYLALSLAYANQEGWISEEELGTISIIVRKSLLLIGYIQSLMSGDFINDNMIPSEIAEHMQTNYDSQSNLLKIAAIACAADDYNIYCYWG